MHGKSSVVKFGGVALIVAGVLFWIQYLFMLPVPAPPMTSDPELMAWLAEWKFNMSMADELLFFAPLCLIPAIAALYHVLVKTDWIKTLVGCALLALSIPVYILLVIILGRVVYPVFNIEISAESLRLMFSMYYGGLHTAALIMGIATIVLSLVILKSPLGRSCAYLGFAAGVLDLIGSFPWLIGTTATFICQLASAVWFVVLGAGLIRISRTAMPVSLPKS
ncbi:hypothetical protein R70723_20225 [Paenibacillus sp. FSL R7-0273]|uniref:hypothetical protein n=1 Tax=Paenibacillus sp. FSL R7-0273 TaxID=1536772 RepID=UPI0004F6F64B|nr:hypothetical protein [Paenibacillus sp. FSL R7-0273]AIQ47973.1 hypothetical protein R70723_20225 [Paenibacillus sp. FSL R7-0273]OMF94478.1 hypothetical protein BK144_08070 [Paenibacillus sp. FSL R7-0273]